MEGFLLVAEALKPILISLGVIFGAAILYVSIVERKK